MEKTHGVAKAGAASSALPHYSSLGEITAQAHAAPAFWSTAIR
jgi:hypothetical protein